MSSPETQIFQVRAQINPDAGTGRFHVAIGEVQAVDHEDAISRFVKSMEDIFRRGQLMPSSSEDFLLEVRAPNGESKVYEVGIEVQFAIEFDQSDVVAEHSNPDSNPANEGLPEIVKNALRDSA